MGESVEMMTVSDAAEVIAVLTMTGAETTKWVEEEDLGGKYGIAKNLVQTTGRDV